MKRSKTFIYIQYTVLALLLFAILFLLRAVPEQKVETAVLKKLEAKEFDSNVYYKHTYWNDIPLVAKEVQRRMTGSEDLSWTKFLLQKRGKPFSRALSINSGNGWVERQLMRDGVILSGVGTDLFQNFVDEANTEAKKNGYNLIYHQLEINKGILPDGPFDMVVMFAAAHHVGRINRLFKNIYDVLDKNGWFVCYEYVGAHRNQFDSYTWEAIKEANLLLPPHLRQNMNNYPHIPTMLASDPSEAQHSELIMETIRRYFFIIVNNAVGGAIAYPLLTHNKRIHESSYKESESYCEALMKRDEEWLAEDPGRTMFAFIVSIPLDGGIPTPKYEKILQDSENLREENGPKSIYYTPTGVTIKSYPKS